VKFINVWHVYIPWCHHYNNESNSLCCRDWLTLSNKKEVLQIEDLIRKFEEFQKACKTILPAVNRHLIEDLILHLQENPNIEYMYKIETFTRKGVDVNKIKKAILDKTGMVPEVYDDGTHYVVNQKLSLETLREISQCDQNILEVRGEYIGNVGLKESEHKYE
jgi:hypothetical protein